MDPSRRSEGKPALDPERWEALCSRLAPALDARAAFDELEAAHAESHRAYHNAEHIVECLQRFDEVAGLAQDPDEVEFALWLHDAIYKSRGGDSEAESAAWAVRLLREGRAPEPTIRRVESMILATKHSAEPPFPDAALMVDIDLSILGRDPARFDRYEQDVRREYRWVPGPLFRSKRKEMLVAFLARPHLYATEFFRERYEGQARENLARSIASL
ncbi:hypothetical protein Poly30_46030 [Planctomycetes bacterium Poly30]|uniref:N-methyl-D-aspartate receptor NMDAR2C subunit n=1 Tax=Saltatorellus ferox TaxID=2528018 RepID=A0A518EY79_9BACT|nr:hypothetical protein Poly30_46030 [Planctomycetes bacterium Poly30]